MARDFDGSNDNVSFGSDTSIDDFVSQSMCCWYDQDNTFNAVVITKDRAATWMLYYSLDSGDSIDKLWFQHAWSTQAGLWKVTADVPRVGRRHMCCVYNGAATTNDPVIYIDGVLATVTEQNPPTGTWTADAARSLFIGENGLGGLDLDGRVGWLNYHNALFTADDVNRAKWWGRAYGGLKVYHPFVTTKLANEGTATANGTVGGTNTNAALVAPVVRPGTALLGCGVGW